MRRLMRFHLYAFLFGLALFAAGIAENNLAVGKPYENEFRERLDRSMRGSTDWMAGQPVVTNAYLIYMLRDCVEMSKEPNLAALLGRSAPLIAGTYLARIIDPNAPFLTPPSHLNSLSPYERWIVHAISRGKYALSPEETAAMFEPHKARTGAATHQLFSLVLYRRYMGSTPALDRLIRQISIRIAQEAAIDFRVTDLYLQRIAFLLAAGQADLVKPRWVERAIAGQDAGGGWFFGWYGWQPTPYKFALEERPNSHATSQGLWLAYMLRYRYPEWIQSNYRGK